MSAKLSLAESYNPGRSTLALDPKMIIEIIIGIARHKPNISYVVDKLVTKGFVGQVSSNEVAMKAMCQELWKVASSLNEIERVKPIAIALSRFIKENTDLLDKCKIALKNGQDDALISLMILSYHYKGDYEFFNIVEKLGPKYLEDISIDIAVNTWKIEGAKALNLRIWDIVTDGRLTKEIGRKKWRNWLNLQETDIVIKSLDIILAKLLKDKDLYEEWLNISIDETMGRLITNKSPSERYRLSALINEMRGQMRGLIQSGHKHSVIFAKWIAAWIAPEIVKGDINWYAVNSNNISFAIQKESLKPASVAEIFSKISEVYPDIELASLSEICNKKCKKSECLELVRDGLPSNFNYRLEILPGQLKAWNYETGKAEFVSKSDLKDTKFAWRLRLNNRI